MERAEELLAPGECPLLNSEMKVATRNNLLRKLSNSKWGANASTIRATALELCYSVAEYATPVCARSCPETEPRAK